MAKIRAICLDVERISYRLSEEKEQCFSAALADQICFLPPFFDCLEVWIEYFLAELHIQEQSVINTKPVLEHLEKVHNWARKISEILSTPVDLTPKKMGKIRTYLRKLVALLHISSAPSESEKKLAAYVALGYIELNANALLFPPKRSGNHLIAPKTSDCEFHNIKKARILFGDREQHTALESGCPTSLSVALLLLAAQQSLDFIKNIEAAQSGERVPEGKKHLRVFFGEKEFVFKPDPVSKAYARPKKVSQRRFVEYLVQSYEYSVGNAWLNRDGRSPDAKKPSPFMLFLDAVKEILPDEARPEGDAFHSLAMSILKERKQQG